jgi:hypothetical protein
MVPSINLAHDLLVWCLSAPFLERLDFAFGTVFDGGFGRVLGLE